MNRRLHTILLLLLAVVFTVGLAFATVELPYLVDGALQSTVRTPSGDSHANDISRLKTELFIAHYHLRAIGYGCFAALVTLIVAGYTTRRSGLAAIGALGFMLPVFAQFAAVMLFLAGLGASSEWWAQVALHAIVRDEFGLGTARARRAKLANVVSDQVRYPQEKSRKRREMPALDDRIAQRLDVVPITFRGGPQSHTALVARLQRDLDEIALRRNVDPHSRIVGHRGAEGVE